MVLFCYAPNESVNCFCFQQFNRNLLWNKMSEKNKYSNETLIKMDGRKWKLTLTHMVLCQSYLI